MDEILELLKRISKCREQLEGTTDRITQDVLKHNIEILAKQLSQKMSRTDDEMRDVFVAAGGFGVIPWESFEEYLKARSKTP
ncbi:hypothetical protein [Aeromonas veronii]|uniref:hypothetical protein n=1 Tax=Aeromonas veronii TaxID=654 RepID=UPI003BA081B7